ncbi:F-box domain-containing protein [Mycena sanguinolenta]|uniref:F-box domain-containing protein n=1 Tax=Mycena sanguinolenta TaxID=230812 RepID=A0A8H7D4U2_9AGAR|nr:F-box domain-containing protein [Mycena sanguinolenta]
MSAEELRTRIEEIFAEIEVHKKLLAELEYDLRLAKRQLNAVVDPVARLPLEISSEIFLRCRGSRFPRLQAERIPMLLLNICSAWTVIALSTPNLWASARICFPCADGLPQILPLWFQRARTQPLTIFLHGDFLYYDHDVSDIIWQHAPRLKTLKISDDVQEVDDESDTDDPHIDLFGSSTPGPLPLLNSLTIRGPVDGRGFLRSQILLLLRLAPNIVECFLDRVELEDEHLLHLTAEKLHLPSLRRLSCINDIFRRDANSMLLSCFTLPALETLSLSMRIAASGDALLSFLARSSPPLRSLILMGPFRSAAAAQLPRCLRLIPTLATLEMRSPDTQLVDSLFTALADLSLLPPPSQHCSPWAERYEGFLVGVCFDAFHSVKTVLK